MFKGLDIKFTYINKHLKMYQKFWKKILRVSRRSEYMKYIVMAVMENIKAKAKGLPVLGMLNTWPIWRRYKIKLKFDSSCLNFRDKKFVEISQTHDRYHFIVRLLKPRNNTAYQKNIFPSLQEIIPTNFGLGKTSKAKKNVSVTYSRWNFFILKD